MPAAIVAIITQILDLIPEAVKAAVDVSGLISQAKAALSSTSDPTDDQWVAVDAALKDLQSQLNIDPS